MKDKKAYQPRPRREILSFLISLCVCADELRAAEGYLLELIACLAFAEWDETSVHIAA